MFPLVWLPVPSRRIWHTPVKGYAVPFPIVTKNFGDTWEKRVFLWRGLTSDLTISQAIKPSSHDNCPAVKLGQNKANLLHSCNIVMKEIQMLTPVDEMKYLRKISRTDDGLPL